MISRKPDIVAPGDKITSCDTDGRYAQRSGTSMAGPAVAGAIALIWNAVPKLKRNVGATIELLIKTAKPISVQDVCSSSGVPNNVYGHGLIDVEKAVKEGIRIYK